MKNYFILLISLLSFSISADFCEKNANELEKLPIQQNGRTKPLLVHSKEMIRFLTGKTSVKFQGNKLDAVTAFCRLSLGTPTGDPLISDLTARVDHVKAQELLGVDGKTIKFIDLQDDIQTLRMNVFRIKEENPYKKSLKTLLNQAALFKDIVAGTNWLTYSAGSWVPIRSVASAGINPDLNVLQKNAEELKKAEKTTFELEHLFAKSHLPSWSLVTTLIALAFLTLFKKFGLALAFSGLTVLMQSLILIFRIYISGRAPITNMYETVMFSGYGALILALILGHVKKDKTYVYMGLCYNMMTLMMMNFATSMLSSSISPLVPVLRDNFWLSTHVTTIILSYGALALSWILANTILIKKKFTNLSAADNKYYGDLIYTCLKYGTVLLGAGILLGGVWADYSWGRFWGWDPKETWSLIAFCLYMAILHGKYTSWISPTAFVPLVAAAFMSIMMAWFGVNYILASGLHSYGFSAGGAVFLGSYFLIQILVIIFTLDNVNIFKSTARSNDAH
jgi:cytochrome c-type biogenesis protein CcsB